MSSLFLFAVNTGARSLTCRHMKLKDIDNFKLFEIDGKICLLLRLNLSTMKSYRNKEHPCQFQSNLEVENSLDFIYWLREHLLKRFVKTIC
jgi:hypothetical protein